MAESTPPPAPQQPEPDPSTVNAQPPASAAPKPRRRRRWPWVIGAILLLLILLVLLAPTIVSMGWARSIVVSQINQRLNGHVEIQDWSLGWTRGIRVDGLVVYDDSNRQILQLPHLRTQLTLASLLRGKYNAGKVEVDGLDVLVVREPDGSLNWDKIARQTTKPGAPSSGTQGGPPSPKKTRLPDVRADLLVNSANITYEDRQQNQTLHLRSLNADVKIPDINQPITNTLTAQAQVNDSTPGTISLKGSVDAVKNNELATDTANVDETLRLQGVHLGAISALLGDKLKMQLVGNTNAQVVVQLKNGTDGVIQASLVSTGFGASGESPGRGTLRSDALRFNLPRTAIRAPHGISNLKSLQITVGNSLADAVKLELKNASVVHGEGPSARQVLSNYTLDFATALNYASNEQGSALAVTAFDLNDNQDMLKAALPTGQNLAVSLPAKGEPQARGTIHLAADLAKLNSIARALSGPQVVAQEQGGAELRSGKLAGDVSLAQAGPQQVQLAGNIDITDITVASAATTPIQNENLKIALKAVANHDFSELQPQLDATGDLLHLHLDNTLLKLSSGSGPQAAPVPMFEKVQKISLRVEAPSLSKLQSLMRAWSPPQKTVAWNPHRPVPGSAMAQASRGPARGALPAGAQAAGTDAAELPPADITSGSAVLTLNGGYENGKLHLTPAATISNLAFKRAQYASNIGNVELKSDATITPAQAGENASITQQIAQLQVAQLEVNAPQLAGTLSLVQPIVVNNPAALAALFSKTSGATKSAGASMSGRILFRGDPGPLMALKDTWNAQPSEHQYGGGYAIDEQFATDSSGKITATGRSDLNDLTIDGQPYPEKALRLLSNVSLDSRNEVLGIDNVSVLSTTTNALNVLLKGRILDLSTKRRIDNVMTADLSYDGAALWKMIVPLLSKETQQSAKDYIVAGKHENQIQIRGSYPANKPFNEAVQSLSLTGEVVLDQFAAKGADLRNLDVPIDLHDGVLRIAYADKPKGQDLPPAATLNGGTIAIGGISADLRQDHLRYSTPKDLKFIDHVTLNPIFASTYLGEFLNNPVFVGAQQATGILNVTVDQCDGLALDDAMKTANSGTAKLDLSLSELHVGNQMIAQLLSIAGVSELKNSLQGDVKSYHVEISQGTLTQDMTLTLAQSDRPLRVYGNVRLADDEMNPMTIDLPWALFAIGKNAQLKQYLPQGIQIPLRGKPGSPSFGIDVNQLVQKTLLQAGQKALQDNLIKGVTGQKSGSTTQPSDQNPLQQLEDLLNQGKKDKKKK